MFKLLSRLALFGVVVLAAVGCSTVSEMYTQKNPAWNGKPFQKVMVIGDFANLVYRKDAEESMCEEMSDASSTKCYRSLDYVFAGDNEDKNITATMNKLNVDALIYVSNLKSGQNMVSTPTITTSSWTSGLITSIGIGGTQAVNYSNYSVSVYTANGETIWTGSVNTSGDDKDDFIDDTSEEVVSKLVDNGIIEPAPPSGKN